MPPKRVFISFLTLFFLLLITTGVIFLAKGYRLDLKSGEVKETGLLLVNSTPDGALIYIDDKPSIATNGSLTLDPGEFTVRVEKPGFNKYQKKITIQKQLVTKVDVLLVPTFPELKPLTSTDVVDPQVSPDGTVVLYKSLDGVENGVWLLDLSDRPFILPNRPSLLLADDQVFSLQVNTATKDQVFYYYSSGRISFSPDSKKILLEGITSINNQKEEKVNLLFDLQSHSQERILDTFALKSLWQRELQLGINKEIEGLDQNLSDKVKSLSNPLFSPDGNLLLYQLDKAREEKEFFLLKLRRKIENESLEAEKMVYSSKNRFVKMSWFPDSKHLIILEKKTAEENRGTIYLIEVDGRNQTKVFEGNLYGQVTIPFLSGSRIAILTTFNPENEQTNLYSIGLR